jgi:23S rRNA pseudouridine1911/1915/1917 synthase
VPEYSRARLQQWIRCGAVTVADAAVRARDRVVGGEEILIDVELESSEHWGAEQIPLDILYEDDQILVVNKPAGLVVHPAAGNRTGTLVNALLHHAPELAQIPRAGIVHRLDKDTTGLMVVARTLTAQNRLVAQLQKRSVKREYQAVVVGVLPAGGSVEAPIGRHPVQRKRMAVVPGGKPALTHYRVLERYRGHTLVRVQLETGRTHQIRVHMAQIRHPVVGDPVYAGRVQVPSGCSAALRKALQGFRRQALHAERLSLEHPVSGETMTWRQDVPADMFELIQILREDCATGATA